MLSVLLLVVVFGELVSVNISSFEGGAPVCAEHACAADDTTYFSHYACADAPSALFARKFADPLPLNDGDAVESVLVELYGGAACDAAGGGGNASTQLVQLSVLLNDALVDIEEAEFCALPAAAAAAAAAAAEATAGALCFNCARSALIASDVDAALWQAAYNYGGNNTLRVEAGSGAQRLCLSVAVVTLNYSEPQHFIGGMQPPAGPVAGLTNVTVSGVFLRDVNYECVFGAETWPARHAADDEFVVSCLSPVSPHYRPQIVPFNVREKLSKAPLRRKRSGGDDDDGGGPFSFTFQYYKPAYVYDMSPHVGPSDGGTNVTMRGHDFVDIDGFVVCEFGERRSLATVYNGSVLACETPPGAGDVRVRLSFNAQQFETIGSFSYTASTPPNTNRVSLSFLELGMIAGGAILLLVALFAFVAYIGCDRLGRRRYTQLTSVGPDGKTTVEVVDVSQIHIQQRIGKGSFADVYRAYWRGSEIAVKKLPQSAVGDAQSRHDLEREAQLMSRLRHPNVLMYLGTCEVPPDIYILTEYMAQGSLYRLLHAKRLALSWDAMLSVLLDTSKGMAYLHGSSPTIIHRDLKSHNILINEHWRAKVCDFGLSRIVAEQRNTMTACGTPCWTAPEVLRNQRYSTKADVYSFGIVLWESVTRRDPYASLPPFQVIFAVATQHARPPVPVDCPPEMAALMRAAWAEDPDARPEFTTIIERLVEIKLIMGGGGDGDDAPTSVMTGGSESVRLLAGRTERRPGGGEAAATEARDDDRNSQKLDEIAEKIGEGLKE